MAASAEKKTKCVTKIPQDWPVLTGPAYHRGMTADEGRKAWFDFLRTQREVGPTPMVRNTDPR